MCYPSEFKTYYIAGVAEWFSLVIVSPRRGFDSLHRLNHYDFNKELKGVKSVGMQ